MGEELANYIEMYPNGILKRDLESTFLTRYDPILLKKGISFALDELMFLQVLDEPPSGSMIDEDIVWYLKPIDEETRDRIRSLNHRSRAILKLLYEKDTPDERGCMPISEILSKLETQGYDISNLVLIYVLDLVESYSVLKDGEQTWYAGIVPEFERTNEYKQNIDDAIDARQEKEELMRLEHDRAETLLEVWLSAKKEGVQPEFSPEDKAFFESFLTDEDLETRLKMYEDEESKLHDNP